jgi:hypothetical protein
LFVTIPRARLEKLARAGREVRPLLRVTNGKDRILYQRRLVLHR